MNKSLFMQFVVAVITLATTQKTDADTLAKAQADARGAVDALEQLKASDAAAADANKLSDEENAQVQQALNLISAAPPAAPADVAHVEQNVDQTAATPPVA